MAKKQTKKEKKSARPSIAPPPQKVTVPPASAVLASMTNWLLILVILLPLLFSRTTIDPVVAPRYIFLSGFVLVFVLFFMYGKKEPFRFLMRRSLNGYSV
jgi:hypothetical protein